MNLSLVFESFESFAAAVAPIAITALWQGALVALGLAVCLRFAPRITAGHRFVLWASGFVVLISLPFLPQISGAIDAGLRSSAPLAVAPSIKSWVQLDVRWSLLIALGWIAGSVLRAADLATHTFRLRKLWQSAVPVASRTVGHRTVEVCKTIALDRPSAIGFFAPRILIPEWLFDRLTPGELDQILLHEAEHLRRADDWTNLLQKLCLVLFPLNPALWWIERQLCKTREMACDDGVIRVTCAPRAYAACLTSLAERELQHRTGASLSLGAWHRRSELVHRVHSILRRRRTMHPTAAGVLLAALGCSLFAVSVAFANCPQLVAFVPSQRIANEALVSDHWQADSARALPASYTQASRSASARPAFYAMQTKAVMPMPEQSTARIPKTSQASHRVHPQAADAKLTEQKLKRAAVQEWIVFTSWQLETSDGRDAQVSDYGAAARSNSGANAPSEDQGAGRVTVTRLIFKVLPAGSNSPQPTAVPVRDGWFVIQL
jgi:beta-lactamase regulating signal transducer with metallopeptidase domain